MLISDSHQFVFVHVRKAAGTSLRQLLSPVALTWRHSRWQRIGSATGLIRDYRRFAFRPHEPLPTAQRIMPEAQYQSYLKCAFVRNPWARLLSEYRYILDHPEHHRHRRVSALGGLDGFIEYQASRPDAHQHRQVSGLDGQCGLDFIGKVEFFKKDVRRLCDRLDLPCEISERLNTTSPINYRTTYSTSQRHRIAELWADDIEWLEYEY